MRPRHPSRWATELALAILMAVSAEGGMLYALGGAGSVPRHWLDGSPFHTFIGPGLILGIVVGGTQALAALALWRHDRHADDVTACAALVLLAWIAAETLMIGLRSPLQPIVAVYGAVQFALAVRTLIHEEIT